MTHTKLISNPIQSDVSSASGAISTPPLQEINKTSYQLQNIQRKLTVGTIDDPLEHEADVMADKVMRMSETNFIQRSADCEEEEKIQRKPLSMIQRKESSSGMIASSEVSNAISASRGSGANMDEHTLSFMENSFGADFSNVKIHTGNESIQMNRELNAKAFTVGSNIYFNEGQYRPQSAEGKHLLAHELTHTVQQDAMIRRMPKDVFGRELGFVPTPQQEAFDAESARMGWDRTAAMLELDIWADPVYQKLKEESRLRVKSIVDMVKTKPPGDNKGERYYYLKKLKVALSTPFNGTETGDESYGCSPDTAAKNQEKVDKALEIEKKDWNGLFADAEENMVATGRPADKVERTGEQGKKFYVYRNDLTNIRVHMKVMLIGAPDEVSKIKQLEDAIEREVSLTTKGYYLDIEFVNAPGADVFEFSVKFCEWPNSGNWASGPVTLSHEVHHALGLGDRYDYIESHSGNDQMNVPMRLVWFEEELKKTEPNNPKSKMAGSKNPLLNDDVCKVAFDPGPQRDNCISERTKFNPEGSPP